MRWYVDEDVAVNMDNVVAVKVERRTSEYASTYSVVAHSTNGEKIYLKRVNSQLDGQKYIERMVHLLEAGGKS